MKRTPFKRKAPAPYVKPEREYRPVQKLTAPVNYARFDSAMSAAPKENPVRSAAYRKLVASLPCIRCGIVGYSQAAHADQGKGAHIKADDRTCYPACCTRPGYIGCHAVIGSTGTYTREERRALEIEYGIRTRQKVRQMGKWPKGIPHMEEQTELELEPA